MLLPLLSVMIALRDFFGWEITQKKYYDSDNELYYSVTVNNRIKKFDDGGAKRYFMKNVNSLLPVILANRENFY